MNWFAASPGGPQGGISDRPHRADGDRDELAQCGTAVAGTDPATSVLDPNCRSHDVDNLWVVDSSFFPSSAALNPALTIAANALRVAPAVVDAAR